MLLFRGSASICTASKLNKQITDPEIKNDLALLKPEEAEQRRKLQGYITVEGPVSCCNHVESLIIVFNFRQI